MDPCRESTRNDFSPELTGRWENKRVPMSLSTHLADIYLEELEKVLALEADSDVRCQLYWKGQIDK